MFIARADGITIPDVVVGCAMFYGGLVQFIAGALIGEKIRVWLDCGVELNLCCCCGVVYTIDWFKNCFLAIYIPWFVILDAYKEKESRPTM
nr:AIF_HP1_G0030480.mRNA.1.CDS.1 [Saccharomyces cerevisiae]